MNGADWGEFTLPLTGGAAVNGRRRLGLPDMRLNDLIRLDARLSDELREATRRVLFVRALQEALAGTRTATVGSTLTADQMQAVSRRVNDIVSTKGGTSHGRS